MTIWKCRHCGRHFNSDALPRCPFCRTRVGEVNPNGYAVKEEVELVERRKEQKE